MFKQKSKTTKIILLVLIFSTILSLFTRVQAGTNESYDYTYVGVKEMGNDDGKNATAIMQLKDKNENTYDVYCIDKDIIVKNNENYALTNIEDETYYNTESANKIRNIVINSYPTVTVESLIQKTKINNLTKKEAIAGAQAAIWYYSNNKNQTALNGRAKQLYDWYLALPERSPLTAKVANIDIKQETSLINDKYELTIKYKADTKNVDGSEISLQYKFDKDITSYDGKVTNLGKDSDGYTNIKVTNLPKNLNIKVSIYGTQKLSYNAYFYSPQGGKENSQSLVGVRDDTTNILKTMDINLDEQGQILTINKIDAKELTGISGVQFKIASDENMTQNVKNVTTGENGKVAVVGLSKGIWYVKEISTPEGYIPNTEVTKIYINEVDIQLDIKNSKLGKAELVKKDEFENPVEGTKFSLYKDLTDNEPLYTNLTTDSQGKITIQNLMPGKYILVETETPDDYILDSMPIEFNVEAYNTTTISHINETKGYGIIKLYKKDAVTNEQLGDTKIGIYADPEYKTLLKTITTSADEAVVISDLRPGTYYIKELEAKAGYLLDSAPKKVTIEKNQTVEVTFYNSKNYSTAGNYATIMIAGGTILIVGLACLIIKRRINRRENV